MFKASTRKTRDTTWQRSHVKPSTPKSNLSRCGSHRAQQTAWNLPGLNTRTHLIETVLSIMTCSSFGKTNILECTFLISCQVACCQNSCEWWRYLLHLCSARGRTFFQLGPDSSRKTFLSSLSFPIPKTNIAPCSRTLL